MEFREFRNPEEKDYDINSSLNSSSNTINNNNYYSEQLIDLIGILENVTEEDLEEHFGISMQEYFNPNAETIAKVKEKLNSFQSSRHRW